MRRRVLPLADDSKYEPITAVPDGIVWKPSRAPRSGLRASKQRVVLYSIGNIYRLIRDLVTGDVAYFMLKGSDTKKSAAESIDAEPVAPGQQRFLVGQHCWFIIDTRWFACEVMKRGAHPPTITLRSTTGWDAERLTAWPHGDELEFSASPSSPLFRRLRKLSARAR